MGIMVRTRHYWSNRNNKAFYFLRDDGELQEHNGAEFLDTHTNYNVFNIHSRGIQNTLNNTLKTIKNT